MRDPRRIDRVLDKLRVLWVDHPDQRLGQLVANLSRTTDGRVDSSRIFNLEDDDMEIAIEDATRHGF